MSGRGKRRTGGQVYKSNIKKVAPKSSSAKRVATKSLAQSVAFLPPTDIIQLVYLCMIEIAEEDKLPIYWLNMIRANKLWRQVGTRRVIRDQIFNIQAKMLPISIHAVGDVIGCACRWKEHHIAECSIKTLRTIEFRTYFAIEVLDETNQRLYWAKYDRVERKRIGIYHSNNCFKLWSGGGCAVPTIGEYCQEYDVTMTMTHFSKKKEIN